MLLGVKGGQMVFELLVDFTPTRVLLGRRKTVLSNKHGVETSLFNELNIVG